MEAKAYVKLALMLVISLFIMYGVMFLNVDQYDHIYLSLTRLYMALLMVSPMPIIMIGFMGKMYPKKKLNGAIIAGGIVTFVLAFILLRQQVFISDKQYMEAMIPHHSSAIMTSKQATIKNPEVKKLSQSIIESQQREIEEMKQILKRVRD
jgi:hypothetical protein